jgi:hypothetical protein
VLVRHLIKVYSRMFEMKYSISSVFSQLLFKENFLPDIGVTVTIPSCLQDLPVKFNYKLVEIVLIVNPSSLFFFFFCKGESSILDNMSAFICV